MVHLNMTARYILTNSLLDSTQVLSSTTVNDSLLISNGDGADSQLWYFTEGSTSTNYRLHTVEKGEFYALDVFNYIGHSTIDLHFFSTGDYNGQYWTVDDEDDGSVKLSNGFTGPDMYLEVMDDSLAVKLAGGNSKGQHWNLSQWYGSFVSPTSTSTRSSTASSTSKPTATPTTLITTGIPTSSCAPTASTCLASATATSSPDPTNEKGGLKTGAKVGIAVGVVVIAAIALGLLTFCLCRRRRRRTTSTTYPVSQIDRAGRLED